MKAVKSPGHIIELPVPEIDVDARAVRKYMMGVPLGMLSAREKTLLREGEEIEDHEERVGLLIGSLRKDFFPTENPESLRLLGSMRKPDNAYAKVAQFIVLSHIHADLTQHAEQGYWLRPLRDCGRLCESPLSTLATEYTFFFRKNQDILHYIMTQEDPLGFVESLESVLVSREAEVARAWGVETRFYGTIDIHMAIGIIDVLQKAQSPDDKNHELLDLPYEVALNLITPAKPGWMQPVEY